jgi:methylphosphotriester-DNA--protein-cysteine methyltransferase
MTVTLANISLVNISSVQAATTDNTGATSTNNTSATTTDNTSVTSTNNAIKVSLANIEDIITENNLNAKMYANTRDNAKLTYDDVNNSGDVTAAKTALQDAETANTAYNNALKAYKLDPANNTNPTKPTNGVEAAQTTLTNAETALTNAKYTLRNANITYSQNLEALAKTAQNDYISYILSDLPTKEYDTANVQLLKKAADVAKTQYDNGFLSKNDYTTAQLNYTSAINTSNASSDTEKNDKAKLYYDLGISLGQNVNFDTNLEQDLEDVSKINYNDDLTQMFNNNLALQADNIGVDKASDAKDNETDSSTDNANEVINNNFDNAQMQLELDKNNSEKNFKEKYDALMNSYATMKSSSDSLDQQKNNYNIAQIQYDYGFASQNDVDTSKVTSLKTSESFEKDKSTFYANYLLYIQMKEGY